jgi:hypothetical protein
MKSYSILFLSLFTTCVAMAQIPNASFETWTAHTGYDTPDSWGNTNSLTTLASTYTCEKGTGGATGGGSYYLKLTSKTVLTAVIPGVAVTGTISLTGTTYGVSGGFACTTRPQNLTGSWQYQASGADHAQIIVLLSKWNTALSRKDTVSFTTYAVPGLPTTQTTWATFTIPLTYKDGKYPDTAMILASSSATTPVAGSYIYLDNLAFSGSVASGVAAVAEHTPTTIYPNPAKENVTVDYYCSVSGNVNIYLTDIAGHLIKNITVPVASGNNNISLDLAGQTKGIYLITLTDGEGYETKKLILE